MCLHSVGCAAVVSFILFRLTLISKWYQVDSDQEKENISVEKMGRKKKIRTTTLPGEALPKKQLSKEDKTSAMEEKKLRKEVSVLYVTFSNFCFLINS